MAGMFGRLLVLLGLLATGPASAQAKDDPLAMRADQLVALFNGGADVDALFSPAFLAQVPKAQVVAISEQLGAQFGKALAVEGVAAKGPRAGAVTLGFERGTLTLDLAVAAAPPHRIEGLVVTGSALKGDTLAKVAQEIWGLPGEASLAVARLDGTGPPAFSISHKSAQSMAVGSTFKTFILAELARQITAGTRKWSDVVTLDRRSLPSGLLQDWPPGSPLTLHTLAALMIARSDNTATDMLLHTLGREKIEALLPTLGVKAPERNRPFLSTLEAFALKTGDPAFLKRWTDADQAGRRALLASDVSRIAAGSIDLGKVAAGPSAIDTVEWFASTEDLVRTMDWLRRNAGEAALDILAINDGIGAAAARDFAYLGYKGGSEPGVISMTFLVRTKAGRWSAVSGSWNDKAAKLDEAKFVALMTRAVALLR